MKKLSAASSAFGLIVLSFFGSASPAFAQLVNIDPCPRNQPGHVNFNPVCALDLANSGGLISRVITLLFIAATLIALIFLIYGGIKWITSGGDKAGVEGARNMIVAALVGLVIVFLSYVLLKFVFSFFGIDISNFNFAVPNQSING